MSAPTPTQESSELARFRQEWLDELRSRKIQFAKDAAARTKPESSSAAETSQLPQASQGTAPATQRVQDAVVGRAPRMEGKDGAGLVQPTLQEVEDLISSALTLKPIKSLPERSPFIQDALAEVIKGFPENLVFEPEDEGQPVFLNKLPVEIFVSICKRLDVTSVERLARACRWARVLTLDASLWRKLVCSTYIPPQLTDVQDLIPVIERYSYDYRRLYIEQPRVRLDGVYIAICHYLRDGLGESSFMSVTHIITYHRYLRFFPNGQVLSLLTNEDNPPQQVIALLKPTLRMKGLFIGKWKLVGDVVYITDLIDASGRYEIPDVEDVPPAPPPLGVPTTMTPSPSVSLRHSGDSNTHGAHHPHPHGTSGTHGSNTMAPIQARYAFVMTLRLRSRPLGRWNRMDIESYESVHRETGEIQLLGLKHERPFWFSKVRSYTGVAN